MKLWLLVSLPLYLLDQITKALVRRTISTEELIPIIPGFLNLVQVHNTGAAFGVLRDNNLFFVVLSISALIILIVLARKEYLCGPELALGMRVACGGGCRQSHRPPAARPCGGFHRCHPALVRPLAGI